jgi:dinuclear metal center YbgI/SA1388 family protein
VTTTLRDITATIDELWPLAGQEDWDNSGVISGASHHPVSSVLFAVDITDATVSEAIVGGFDALISHHPLLLKGMSTVDEDRYKGELIARLIRGGCAAIGVHTNGDRVPTGTSASLAKALGVSIERPIVSNDLGGGLGVIGQVPEQTLGEFAKLIASKLPATTGGVRVSGEFARRIHSVSLCAGAGDALLAHPDVTATDVYVTSDLRHHPASEFRQQARLDNDTALIDVSHWAAEWIWLGTAASEFRIAQPDVAVTVSDINTDPWSFAVMQ